MCKWAHSKLHGFQWNHEEQEVEEPHIVHKSCRNKAGLIGYPFKEYWLGQKDEAVKVSTMTAEKTCGITPSTNLLLIDDGKLQRQVYDQDGVTDLVIEEGDLLLGADFPYTLQLETPIQADDILIREPEGQAWWFQDLQSRMTILADVECTLTVVKRGTIQLVISQPMRVRVIVENIDTFYRGSKKRANYFGSTLQSDFFSPLEFYSKA